MWKHAEECLRFDALGGIGDQTRERFFRMCITACLHRGIRPDELASIPKWWHDAEAIDIAGGPVEVLWQKGVPEIPSAMPCHNPGRQIIGTRLDLWVPVDCGECEPCIARQNVRVCKVA
jgi:hypothetical protein